MQQKRLKPNLLKSSYQEIRKMAANAFILSLTRLALITRHLFYCLLSQKLYSSSFASDLTSSNETWPLVTRSAWIVSETRFCYLFSKSYISPDIFIPRSTLWRTNSMSTSPCCWPSPRRWSVLGNTGLWLVNTLNTDISLVRAWLAVLTLTGKRREKLRRLMGKAGRISCSRNDRYSSEPKSSSKGLNLRSWRTWHRYE